MANQNPKPPFDEAPDNWIIYGRIARELHNGVVKDPEEAIQLILLKPLPLSHAIDQLNAILVTLRKVAGRA